MTGARQATVLALVLALVPLYIVVAGGGSPAAVGLCGFGLAMFGIGMMGGQAGLVVGGLIPLLFGAALGVSENPSQATIVAALMVLGVIGPWCLIVADVSWWLRRDAEVELRVFSHLARSGLPASLVGALMALGALAASDAVDPPQWLVPAVAVGAAIAITIVGETVRRRRPDRVTLPGTTTTATLSKGR